MTTQERAARRLAKGAPPEAGGVQKVTNLWVDAFARLLRNKAAILGVVIVLSLILIAALAPWVAPFGYSEGDSAENYMIPPWVDAVFPGNMSNYAQVGDKFVLGAHFHRHF